MLAVPVLGRLVPATRTDEGTRAASDGRPVPAESVETYRQKSGESYDEALGAMRAQASSLEPEDLAERGFSLYERFRPSVPAGTKGWGARGGLLPRQDAEPCVWPGKVPPAGWEVQRLP